MSDYILEVTYRGAQLKLEIHERNEGASLIVNGIVRGEEAGSKTLRLESTVQTDYEWHELIEGMVQFEPGKISATIFANKVEVAHRIFVRGET